MAGLAIIYSKERIDFYDGNRFSYCIPRCSGAMIPASEGSEINAFISEPSLVGEFEAALGQTPYSPIAGPSLIETDNSLVYLNEDNHATVIQLSDLFSDLIEHLCDQVNLLQTQNGFFAMIPDQVQSLKSFLSALLKVIYTVPDSFSVPIFAWYNYALADEATIVESDIPTAVELPFALVDRNLYSITTLLSNNGVIHDNGKQFIRNAIIKKAINAL